MKEELLKGIREKALRVLAKSGRYDALHCLNGYLHQFNMERQVERFNEAKQEGDFDTDLGVRNFINSIN